MYLGHTLCGTLVDMGNAGGANNLTCGGNATGRVVRVEQLNKYLTVCELKVMGKSLFSQSTSTPNLFLASQLRN